MISYEECAAILDTFRPNGTDRRNEIGTRVWVDAGVSKLTVIVRDRSDKEVKKLPSHHIYWYDKQTKSIPIEVAEGILSSSLVGILRRLLQSLFRFLQSLSRSSAAGKGGGPGTPKACGGDRVIGSGGKKGTAGWFFVLENRLMCLGNSHVFGPNETITVKPDETTSHTGSIIHRLPVNYEATNEWDLAIACMKDPKAVEVAMRPGGGYLYPQDIASDIWVGDDTKSYRAVTGHTGWGAGQLYAVWSGWIMYGGNPVPFRNQLQFVGTAGSPMTAKGDSGTIAIRNEDNAVVGLVFGLFVEKTPKGKVTFSLASPLYRLGMKYKPSIGFPTYEAHVSNVHVPVGCPHAKGTS